MRRMTQFLMILAVVFCLGTYQKWMHAEAQQGSSLARNMGYGAALSASLIASPSNPETFLHLNPGDTINILIGFASLLFIILMAVALGNTDHTHQPH